MSIFPINQDNNHTGFGMLVMVNYKKQKPQPPQRAKNPTLHCTQTVEFTDLAH